MLIGISGRIGSGKNTVADLIVNKTPYMNWEQKSFAHKLKKIAGLLLNVPVAMFEDREYKQTFLGPEWGGITVREFLQKLGTEAMRNGLRENVWENALFSEYTKDEKFRQYTLEEMQKYTNFDDAGNPLPSPSGEFSFELPNWIITDVRFPNEADAVKNRGGILIRVNRPGLEENNHPSETSLDGYQFDYYIQNNGTLEQLSTTIEIWLIQMKLLKTL